MKYEPFTNVFQRSKSNRRPVWLHLISHLTRNKNNKQRQTIRVLYTARSLLEASCLLACFPSARCERSERRRIAKFSEQRSGEQLQGTMGNICVGQSRHVGSEHSPTHVHACAHRKGEMEKYFADALRANYFYPKGNMAY